MCVLRSCCDIELSLCCQENSWLFSSWEDWSLYLIVTPTPGGQCIFSQRTWSSLLGTHTRQIFNNTGLWLQLPPSLIVGVGPSVKITDSFPLSMPRPRLFKSLSGTWLAFLILQIIPLWYLEMRRSPNPVGMEGRGVGRDRNTQRDIVFSLRLQWSLKWGNAVPWPWMSSVSPCLPLNLPFSLWDFHLVWDGWMPLDRQLQAYSSMPVDRLGPYLLVFRKPKISWLRKPFL